MVVLFTLGMMGLGGLASGNMDTPELPNLKAPPFTVDVRVTAQQQLEFKARPPASHHFNVDAPIALTTPDGKTLAPAGKQENDVRFHAPIPTQSSDYTFSIYLCDDAKTFCEKHTLIGHWAMPEAGSGAALAGDWSTLPLKAAATAAAVAGGAPEGGTATNGAQGDAGDGAIEKDKFGFTVNDADRALASAKAQNKPLLIDFFGIWCPPCNELDEEVFGSSEFKKASAGFVLLKLDVDTTASWALKSKYKIAGYPTVILASPDGDEITRIVGSRPRHEFVRLVKVGWDRRAEPFAALKAKADTGDKAAAGRVGEAYLNRQEFAPAVAYLNKADDPALGEKLADARIGVLTPPGGAPLIGAYESAIRDFPSTPESIERRAKLADLYASVKPDDWQSKQRKTLVDLVATGKTLAKHPSQLENHDMSVGDLWENIASAEETLGDPEVKASWLKGAQAYGKKIHSDRERGNSLEQAFCYWNGGEPDQAEKIYDRLEKYYPTEFTYYFSHARMAYALKKMDLAKEKAKAAYDHSYGDNRLRVTKLYAQVLDATGDRPGALSLIHDTLAAADIPNDPTIRTHRYADDLKALQASLGSSASSSTSKQGT